jgi:hypothetical protein
MWSLNAPMKIFGLVGTWLDKAVEVMQELVLK